MTVGELIKALNRCPINAEVICNEEGRLKTERAVVNVQKWIDTDRRINIEYSNK